MKAVWIRARSELRAGVRSWIALAILVGLGGGFVIAAAVGGRRTDTSYDRLVRTSRGWDVLVTNFPDPGIATFDPAKVERLPQVTGAARFLYDFSSIGPGYAIFAPADERSARLVPLRVLRGRLPDPRRVDQVAMSFALADQFGFRVGSTFPLIKTQVLRSVAEQGFSVPQNIRLKVVGIVSGPGEFPPLSTDGFYLHMTPAYYKKLAPFAYQPQGDLVPARRDAVAVRLRQGLKDLPAFRQALLGISEQPGALEIISQDDLAGDVDRSIHYQAVALWLLAGLAGVAMVLIFSQTLARQIHLETDEYPVLRALGMSRGQLWLVAMARAVAIGAVGGAIAVGVAILLSPLTPIGLARIAEPRPGFWVDGWALAPGAGAVLAAVVILAVLPAWRTVRLASVASGASTPLGDVYPSFVAGTISRAGAPATMVMGVRMALEPGRGRTAVPVRTTLLGVTIAVSVMVGAFGFAASLDRLLAN
ncbi:MAG TPA: FtsX-like permease family protein, partial [Actinomycetota bacterium]|nr:FtsX-like permease family protein [Actinomycetota bacterium]